MSASAKAARAQAAQAEQKDKSDKDESERVRVAAEIKALEDKLARLHQARLLAANYAESDEEEDEEARQMPGEAAHASRRSTSIERPSGKGSPEHSRSYAAPDEPHTPSPRHSPRHGSFKTASKAAPKEDAESSLLARLKKWLMESPLFVKIFFLLFSLLGLAAFLYALSNPFGLLALLGITGIESTLVASLLNFACWAIYQALVGIISTFLRQSAAAQLMEIARPEITEVAEDVANKRVSKSEDRLRKEQEKGLAAVRKDISDVRDKAGLLTTPPRVTSVDEAGRLRSTGKIKATLAAFPIDERLNKDEKKGVLDAHQKVKLLLDLVKLCDQQLVRIKLCLGEVNAQGRLDPAAKKEAEKNRKFVDETFLPGDKERLSFLRFDVSNQYAAKGDEIVKSSIILLHQTYYKDEASIKYFRLTMRDKTQYKAYIDDKIMRLDHDIKILQQRAEILEQQLFYIARQDLPGRASNESSEHGQQKRYRDQLRAAMSVYKSGLSAPTISPQKAWPRSKPLDDSVAVSGRQQRNAALQRTQSARAYEEGDTVSDESENSRTDPAAANSKRVRRRL